MRADTAVLELVNIDKGFVLCTDGEKLPITHYFDDLGEDCTAADAVCVVAGRDGFGWMAIDVQGRSALR